jgi:hypothetical protein
MSIRWLTGDCRETLRTLAPGSVHAVITSPPYYSLRDYQTPPLVWGGDAEHEHAFGSVVPGDNRGGSGTFNGRNGHGEGYGRDATRGQFCECGAWLGSLGLEPTPDCGRAASKSTEMELRHDLTPEQRAYVFSELARLGVMR